MVSRKEITANLFSSITNFYCKNALVLQVGQYLIRSLAVKIKNKNRGTMCYSYEEGVVFFILIRHARLVTVREIIIKTKRKQLGTSDQGLRRA